MSDAFEGDLIRPLGLVTLNFAYAEHELDLLLAALNIEVPVGDAERAWTVGRKLKAAQVKLNGIDTKDLSGLIAVLDEARALFDRRNNLIHSCIFAGGRVVSNRHGVPEVSVTSGSLTELANRIFTCKEHINMHRCRYLHSN